MLRIFKSNDPYLLILVFAVLMILRTAGWLFGLPFSEVELKWLLVGERLAEGFQMYSDTYDYTAPLSAYTYKFLHFIGGRSRFLPQLLATLIIMFQAAQLNLLLLRNSAFEENNYLPALFYVVLASALGDAYVLSPALMSLTFVLLALNNVFRRIDNIVRDEIFLNAGLYLGLATLFYLPSFLYFLLFLAALLLFSSPAPRRLLLYLYGFLMPILICLAYFYWFGAHWDFVDSFFRGAFNQISYAIGWDEFLRASYLFLAFSLLSIVTIIRRSRFTNYQEKIFRVMLLILLTGSLLWFVDVELGRYHFIYLVPSISFMLTHFVLLVRKRIWKVTMPYLLLISAITFPFVLYNQDQSTNYKATIDNEMSLMYLGPDLGMYRQYRIASPFLDRKLSEDWLEKLDYYQTATKMGQTLVKSQPTLIADEWGVAEDLFYRFPQLSSTYERQGEFWVRKPTEKND